MTAPNNDLEPTSEFSPSLADPQEWGHSGFTEPPEPKDQKRMVIDSLLREAEDTA